MEKIFISTCKRLYHYHGKYINGGKGVISLFLAILMLPFTMIAGILINSARVNSAVAIFDEALCNASDSTLGTYDPFLRKRFGLLAMEQNVGSEISKDAVQEFIAGVFEDYMRENVKVLSNTYHVNYDDPSNTVTGIYSLADRDILLNQILEYSKYSVPARIVDDGLHISDLLNSLEGAFIDSDFLDILGYMNNFAKVGDKYIDLDDHMNELEKSIIAQDSQKDSVGNNYIQLENVVNQYVNKVKEKGEALSPISDSISKLKQQYNNLSEEEKELDTDLSGRISKEEENYKNVEKDYDNQIDLLGTQVISAKSIYSSSLAALITIVGDVKGNIEAIAKDTDGIKDATKDVAKDLIDVGINKSKDNIDKNIEEIKKKQAGAETREEEFSYEKQIDLKKQEKNELSNLSVIADASKEHYDTALGDIVDVANASAVQVYENILSQLNNKKTNIDNLVVNESLSTLQEELYKVDCSTLITAEQCKEAIQKTIEKAENNSAWDIIKALLSFLDAIFSLQLFFDPNLTCVMDETYYKNTYGGLPSEKDREAYPLTVADEEDAKLSEHYKKIFGDYDVNQTSPLDDFSFHDMLQNVGNSINIISEIVKHPIKSLGDIGNSLKAIYTGVSTIIEQIKEFIEFVIAVITHGEIYKKLLLAGYVNYMTSDRTTYKDGVSLTGEKFALRKQELSIDADSTLDGFKALFGRAAEVLNIKSGTAKCFGGAEKEYILYGSKSEAMNQILAFRNLYMLRFLTDILPIMVNKEVQAIAALCPPLSSIAFVVYIFVEPLIDVVLLVNQKDICIIKRDIYLIPSGIGKLIGEMTKLKLSTSQMDQARVSVLKAVKVDEEKAKKYAEITGAYIDEYPSEDSKGLDKVKDDYFDGLLSLNYSQYLFLLMFVFTDENVMLNRLSDIIEMESVVNAKDKLFDLDYSYTYIRASMNFQMNEFIKISNEVDPFTSKKRTIYRGY